MAAVHRASQVVTSEPTGFCGRRGGSVLLHRHHCTPLAGARPGYEYASCQAEGPSGAPPVLRLRTAGGDDLALPFLMSLTPRLTRPLRLPLPCSHQGAM